MIALFVVFWQILDAFSRMPRMLLAETFDLETMMFPDQQVLKIPGGFGTSS